ncbi:MAG: hypothetical protein K2X27_07230 [Candidatus Obscuribacterales bacterium]|nr:hypothetical protein [Candidatus Obscuribacterales bacterium]
MMGRRERDISATLERAASGPVEDPLTLPPGEQFLTRGVLLRNRRQIVTLAVILLVVASLLSYFVKPKAPTGELVSPAQELPGFSAQLPGDNSLAQRVMTSYSLAFVLFESPYTATNVRALENVRSWAQNRFQTAPDFLHPVSIKPEREPNDTMLGALGYNLFAGVRYGLQSAVSGFLSSRIADFHNDPAYKSFSESFFEIYGKDSESATLLAKYQSDKAKNAIDVFLWTILWGTCITGSLIYVGLSPRRQRYERIRHSLVMTWALVAIGYGSCAWMENSIPAFMSALVSAVVALYFLKPIILLTRQDSSLKVFFIRLNSRWLALSVWATYSLFAMAVLTWIRCSLPDSTDPVSMLLSGFSGNFLYDPEEGKRQVARIVGAIWVVVSIWSFMQKDKDASVMDELEAELRSL